MPAIWIAVAIIAVVGIALVAANVGGGDGGGGSSAKKGRTVAPVGLVSQVTSVPQDVVATVGKGSVTKLPAAIDAPALTDGGKPLVLYMGAEYCPFCAAERWALVQALSRFGTFSGLKTTHSSSTDIYPSTPTFSFYGATFTSDVLAFQSVELNSNELSGGTYPTLETPTAAQQEIFRTYDAPPYVPASSAGAIPFIDIAGRYASTGATYSPEVLKGLSAQEIAARLNDAQSAVTQGVVGAANTITAAICQATNQQPAAVCSVPAIQAIQGQLR